MSPVVADDVGFVIGVDLGLESTGVAGGWKGGARTEMESVMVIKSWPGSNYRSYDKITTLLAYTDLPRWGAMVQGGDEPRVSHFILGLQSQTAIQHYGYQITKNWRHPGLPHKQLFDFVTDYIAFLRRYLFEVYFPRHFGKQFLVGMPIHCVVTHPSFWTESAKLALCQVMSQSGFPYETLTLLSDEAATCVYSITACVDLGFKNGDSVIMCNAGSSLLVAHLVSFWFTLEPDFVSDYLSVSIYHRSL